MYREVEKFAPNNTVSVALKSKLPDGFNGIHIAKFDEELNNLANLRETIFTSGLLDVYIPVGDKYYVRQLIPQYSETSRAKVLAFVAESFHVLQFAEVIPDMNFTLLDGGLQMQGNKLFVECRKE